ncbi:MAG: hypothetical protein JXB48_05540 [Candidatus Latescibacteria bacterium]|nr:hypothetical protein [Candidatus Latescibacterota bacterium]
MYVIINFGTDKQELHIIPPHKKSSNRTGKNPLESFRKELGEKLSKTFPQDIVKVFNEIYPLSPESKTAKSIYQFVLMLTSNGEVTDTEEIKKVILEQVKNGEWLEELPETVKEKVQNNAQIMRIFSPSAQNLSLSSLDSDEDS